MRILAMTAVGLAVVAASAAIVTADAGHDAGSCSIDTTPTMFGAYEPLDPNHLESTAAVTFSLVLSQHVVLTPSDAFRHATALRPAVLGHQRWNRELLTSS